MNTRDTVPILVHGANQSAKPRPAGGSYEQLSIDRWAEALLLAPEVWQVLDGSTNADIAAYHSRKNPGHDVPAYSFRGAQFHSVWYGDVWEKYCWNEMPDGDGGYVYKEPRAGSLTDESDLFAKLMASNSCRGKNGVIVAKERGVMNKFFAELVPFYELHALTATGTTLYSEVCESFLDDLVAMTANGEKDYVLIVHSMGCAVSYNVMSHLSLVAANKSPCNSRLSAALSDSYSGKVQRFAGKSAKCLGLLMFGNYIGYNYTQLLNHYILFGGFKKEYPYPESVLHWRNFFTLFGGDPYIIDDRLKGTVVGAGRNRFKDVRIWRIPMHNIGHGRDNWFKRSDFEDELTEALAEDLVF